MTRTPGGAAIYVQPTKMPSRDYIYDVIQVMLADINKRYSDKGWSEKHRQRLARKWKNQFFRWLWSQVDES